MNDLSHMDSIAIVWTVDDVEERCQELGTTLTLAQKRDVLCIVEENHDCNIGVCWDIIDSTIGALVQRENEKAEQEGLQS